MVFVPLKFEVVRPKDTVIVLIMKHKTKNTYSYVNLTKGHICPCEFASVEEAIKDMDKFLSMPWATFKKTFEKLPAGIKKSVMLEISARVRDGEFSEMNKIRLVDEACSSNIAVLLQR